MLLNHNNKVFTNNSNKVSKEKIFVVSNQNKQYVSSAKENGCIDFIESSELRDYFDFMAQKNAKK